MEIIWYIIIVVLLSMFFVLDGYDFGAGIIHLFFAKKENDKQLVAKSAGLFWDSNEVWLVAVGGLLFMAFPNYYASIFSGFYLPLIIVLWLIIFRALGLELRSQVNTVLWRKIWDKSFGVSSLLLALFFGIALGNILRGVNLGQIENGEAVYESQYFFLPLWNSSFSPLHEVPGVIDWFTIIIGLVSVVLLTLHGANWVVLKTNASINSQLKNIVLKLNAVLAVLVVLALVFLSSIKDHAFQNFIEKPYLMLFPVIFIIALVTLFFIKRFDNPLYAFLLSTTLILSGIMSSLASMFPVVLPSTNTINESLTIYNTTTTEKGLSVAIAWAVIGLILVVIYFLVQKKLLGGKIDDIDYGH